MLSRIGPIGDRAEPRGKIRDALLRHARQLYKQLTHDSASPANYADRRRSGFEILTDEGTDSQAHITLLNLGIGIEVKEDDAQHQLSSDFFAALAQLQRDMLHSGVGNAQQAGGNSLMMPAERAMTGPADIVMQIPLPVGADPPPAP